MVDSLHLRAEYRKNRDFRAGAYNTLNYHPNSEDIKGGYIRPNNLLNLDFKPGNIVGIKIEAPQIIHGNNLSTSLLKSKEDFRRLEQEITTFCSMLGLDIDMNNASIIRLDTARDLKTLYPFNSYGNVFSSLNVSHMPYNPSNKKYGGTWFNWSNKTRAITSYSKTSQTIEKGLLFNCDNIMRTETRLFNNRVIREHSEGFLYTYQDLLKEGLLECLGHIFNRNVKGLFKYDYEGYKEFINNDIRHAIINVILEARGGQDALKEVYRLIMASNKDIDMTDLLEIVGDAVRSKYDNKNTVKQTLARYRADIREAYSRALENKTNDGLRLVELYTELKEGFLLVA